MVQTKFYLTFFLILFFKITIAQQINLGKYESEIQLISDNNDGFSLNTKIGEIKFTEINTQKGVFVQLSASNLIKTFQKGNPDLPVYSKLIEVPQDAEVKISILSYDEQIIDLNAKNIHHKIIPAQPSMRKDRDYETTFYYNDLVYNKDDFYKQGKTVIYKESGQMRDKRLGRIELRPFQYNPVTNTLKVLNNLKIKVEFTGSNMLKTNELHNKYGSNFSSLPAETVVYQLDMQRRNYIGNMPITYVIVADRSYEQALQDFVLWKTQKGFNVIEAYTDDPNVGNTVASIKAYCQNLYNNPQPGINPPSFILVVGDVEIVPATQHTEVPDDPYSDLDLAEYTGDYLPEVNFGRWSVDTPQQVADIVAKTIKYEKLQMADISYLHETLLVAGDDEGHEDTYGGGAIYYADNYYLNAAHNINSHTFLQNTIETWPNENMQAHDTIIANINNGVSLANYTAHCSPDGWADPSFSQNDLNSFITNTDKYGIWIANCCQSYKYDENESFGELAIRKPNAGVVGYIGGSQYTYWSEDYWWGVGIGGNIVAQPTYDSTSAGIYDANFHDGANEANDPSKWFLSTYQMTKAGNLAVEASTSTRKDYYWVIYQVAGDPSIIPFIGTPQAMQVNTSPSTLVLGMNSLNVTTAPYAYVALSQNGILLAAASANASGSATLNYDSNNLTVGNADLVVTAQNRTPYISTITVAPSDNPYVVIDTISTDVSPNFGQTVNINMALKNVAASGSSYHSLNTEATLSTTDSYVTITQNAASYGTINAGASQNVNNAYTITLADDIPDQHIINFVVDITGDDSSGTHYNWQDTFIITANAPHISIATLNVSNDDDNNGTLDPGETCHLNYTITNTGHVAANFNGILSESNDPNNYITLSNTNFAPVNIAPGNSVDFVFDGVSAVSSTPPGSIVDLQLIVNAGSSNQYTDTSIQPLQIGIIPIYQISNGGSLSVCEGHFYDSGLDTGDYTDDEDFTMTFLPPSNGFVIIDFNSFELENNYDKLYVHNGTDTNAPQIPGSPFTGTVSPGLLRSSVGLTFHFTSDVSNTATGWDATVSCYTPTAIPNCVSNPIPADATTNIFPDKIEWDADQDALRYNVYFGTDSNPLNNTPVVISENTFDIPNILPQTTYYWTIIPENNIGAPTTCNIWSFTTGAGQYLMQDGSSITTCSGVFFDTGGADNGYASSEDITMTFLPEIQGNYLQFYFNVFDVEISSSGTHYDWLKVYDGVDTTATLIGDFAADDGTIPVDLQPVTATNQQGALTFQFHSDGSVNEDGWEASISCVDVNAVEKLDQIIGIYPNPNNGIFTIKTRNVNDAELFVYAVSGKEIYHHRITGNLIAVDLGKQSKGIYFVKIVSKNGVYNSKIIIK
jgi:hypothetical protein